MREDQDAPTFFDEDVEQFGEKVEFSGLADGVREVIREQPWVAADLAEFE